MTHPLQPILNEDGVWRFKANAIVRYLLDAGGIDLNELSLSCQRGMHFSKDDWTQFYQLIGYSVSGWGDLREVDKDLVQFVDTLRPGEPDDKDKRIAHLEWKLRELREGLRRPIAALYHMCHEDLGGENE